MPNRADIQNEILNLKNGAQDEIRRKHIKDLFEYTNRDTVIYASAFTSGKQYQIPPYLMSIAIDDIQGFMSSLHGLKGNKLDLIIHSSGGSIEATEQIVNYLRLKYEHIRAIIPQNAMSAATMLACSADEILMGKQSALGPIDPQITFPTQFGQFTAPAQSLLDDFEQAKREVSSDRNLAPLWISKMQDYPPGIFNICNDTIELAINKVELWLKTYMFNSDSDKDKKSKDISEWLGKAKNHKTHGHPINYIEAQDHLLNVKLLEEDNELQDRVLSLYHSTSVTFGVTQCVKLIENHLGKGWYVNPPQQLNK